VLLPHHHAAFAVADTDPSLCSFLDTGIEPDVVFIDGIGTSVTFSPLSDSGERFQSMTLSSPLP
jgi:hypothetical protein